MRIKNKLPIKWMLGIVVILMLMANWTHHVSKRLALHHGSSSTSQNSFVQFLEDLFGLGEPNSSSNNASQKNNMQNGNNQNSGSMKGLNTADQRNPNSTSGDNGSASQRSGRDQGEDNAGNNPETNGENNSELNADDSSGNNPDFNAASSSGLNAENNPQDNSGNNPGTNAATNSENPGSNSDNNPGDNSGGNTGSGPGDNPGGNPGSGPGDNPGGNPGSGPGDNPGSPGGGPGGDQPVLPTINPIPSDDAVSQSVAKQNQQNDAAAALIASREALVVPVQQQAQASKYQAVNTQNTPAPSTDLPPADVEAKVQAKQVTFH